MIRKEKWDCWETSLEIWRHLVWMMKYEELTLNFFFDLDHNHKHYELFLWNIWRIFDIHFKSVHNVSWHSMDRLIIVIQSQFFHLASFKDSFLFRIRKSMTKSIVEEKNFRDIYFVRMLPNVCDSIFHDKFQFKSKSQFSSVECKIFLKVFEAFSWY